ncbi:YciI family protein [Paractinoplanes lichenicola]|uniref:YciI family protein n=1 Tax=Paractinoplanes lichenicola TaxID=2802976 RepID=A0ABS1VVM4_9ACTN|nr:YciI family protein [Actinoplanes lichenicola]MBL7258525.1 YciI family protein [Actinoplanes lichenicola]
MRYTLLFHYQELTTDELGPEMLAEGQRAMSSYAATLHAAGVLVSGEVLHPSELSTTVRVRDGSTQVQDGPFADTKEQLAGTIVIDVPDLDAAIEWARQAPQAQWGTVEIRPVGTHLVDGVWS